MARPKKVTELNSEIQNQEEEIQNSDAITEENIENKKQHFSAENELRENKNPSKTPIHLEFIKKSVLSETINKINKKLGIEKATFGNDTRLQPYKIPTASISLNKRMGGGFVRRKIHLSYGEKSSGKTFFDYKTVATLQRLCRNCLGILPINDYVAQNLRMYYNIPECNCSSPEMHRCFRIDYESDYMVTSPKEKENLESKKLIHMEKLGVIGEAYSVAFASSIEECVDILKEVIPTMEYDFVTIDSLQGGQSDYIYEKEGHDETMGVEPRKLNIVLKNIMNSFHKIGIDNYRWAPVVHLISQVRMKVGSKIPISTHSGGKGLEHQNSFTLRWSRESYLGESNQELANTKETIYGLRVGYKNEKFKLDSTGLDEIYFSGTVDLYIKDTNFGFKYGDYNYLREIIDVGIESGKIVQRGSVFDVSGETFKGRQGIQKAIQENPEILKVIL
ncbi:MAG: hypothetical protein ABIK31_02065 [candidate division WOR-3 bacterium]